MTAVSARTRARSAGPSVQEVLRSEALTQAVPETYLESSDPDLGTEDLARERYTSQAYHDREVEKMWRKVWQVACWAEDIPDVGDTLVYDIVDDSIVLVRTAPETIKAYYNSCLHRGTQLVAGSAHLRNLRCPFHGWTWNLDGTVKDIPCKWDFPQVDEDKFGLPEVRVGIWNGWVFITLDNEAKPLADYLGELPSQWAQHPMTTKYKVAHAAAIVPCNWKVALEAFMESYHAPATHPQLSLIFGDTNTQYDVFSSHINRMIAITGIPSPTVGEWFDQQAIVDAYFAEQEGTDAEFTIPEGVSARAFIAEVMRKQLSATGLDTSGFSDSETLDAAVYGVFPNFLPFIGSGVPIATRFRPNGNDPRSAILEVMKFAPLPTDGPRPASAPVFWIDDGDWSTVPNIGGLGPIMNQDMSNLGLVQRGLNTRNGRDVVMSDYQESRIRHFAQTLDTYIAS